MVIDTRIRRDGQLAGFAKVPDLQFFLSSLGSIHYRVAADLAPTASLLKMYRGKELSWEEYAAAYAALLGERRPETALPQKDIDQACLLCSERTADKCHRRLAAEYLRDVAAVDIDVVHL